MFRLIKRVPLIAVVALAVMGSTAAIAAVTEQAHLIPPGAPAGYLKINPNTCKFLHHEIDVAPSANERYARAEDDRDDVKLSCLTRKLNRQGAGGPPVVKGPAVCLDNHPDRRGFRDIRVCAAGDAGFIGYVVAP